LRVPKYLQLNYSNGQIFKLDVDVGEIVLLPIFLSESIN